MSKRLIVTGSRHAVWDFHHSRIADELARSLDQLGGTATLIHGDANGVDSIAKGIWLSLGLPVIGHPARWAKYSNRAGPIRNQEMVASGADQCIAFYVKGTSSDGTDDCVKKARAAGIPVRKVTLKGEA